MSPADTVFAVLVAALILALFLLVTRGLDFIAARSRLMTTRPEDIHALVRHLNISERDRVLELGGGNGHCAALIAKLSGAQVTSYESSRWAHSRAIFRQLISRSTVQLRQGDFFQHDWSSATIIYCYLYAPLMHQIGAKVRDECAPGTWVVSRNFPIDNLPLVDTLPLASGHVFLLYRL